MEDAEMFFLERIKKVALDFKKLYDKIAGHKIRKKKNQDKELFSFSQISFSN